MHAKKNKQTQTCVQTAWLPWPVTKGGIIKAGLAIGKITVGTLMIGLGISLLIFYSQMIL